MAKRLTASHSEEIRRKIQTTQLIKRLENHVLGDVEMSKSQVTAALGLVKLALPQLSSVTVAGDKDNPLFDTAPILAALNAKFARFASS